MTDSAAARIQFSGISKSYGGVLALDDVTFSVKSGSIHAIVGENGAGKSTLMKILAGAVAGDAGRIEIDGRPALIESPRSAQNAGIAIVYQEFSLVPHLTVAENIFLGRWPRSRFGWIPSKTLSAQTNSILRELSLDLPPGRIVESLSVAQQQMVEIAKAVALQAKILILDEPSAVLTPPELAVLFGIIRSMTARGVSVLYISHRLEEIFELADFVTVLRDGRHVSTRPIGEVTRERLILETVGRPLRDEFPPRTSKIGDLVLDVRSLSLRPRFHDITIQVRASEVVALTGMVGSGRSSVGRAIFGAERKGSMQGEFRIAAVRGPFATPRQAKAAGIAYVPEDRKRHGLLLSRALRENITLAHRASAATCGLFRPVRERRLAASMIEKLSIRTASMEAAVSSLSGGNQQKALLGRWLLKPCRLIILDEPTRGVDVGAKMEIYELINELAGRGTAVLMISSELPEVIGMADRVAVMCRGRLAGILDNQSRRLSQEEILRLAVGEQVA